MGLYYLFVRHWKSTLMNIFAPIVFLILLQIIRDLSLTYGASPSLNPQKMRLDEVWPVICCSGTERTSSPSLSVLASIQQAVVDFFT